MAVNYYEDVILQGWGLLDGLTWEDQHIVSYGFWGLAVPRSLVPTNVLDLLLQTNINSVGEYFPQWMDIHFLTHATTGSLLRRFLSGFDKELIGLGYYLNKVEQQRLFNHWLGELSRGWYASSSVKGRDVSTVVVHTTSADIYPNKANTSFEFMTAIGPTFYVDPDGYDIYFRNLNDNIIIVDVEDSLPLGAGAIVKGPDIYWMLDQDQTSWKILEANDPSINYVTGVISLGVTGSVMVSYPSESLTDALDDTGVVYINGGPASELSNFDYWTSLDELGLLFDVPRLLQENNVNYFRRLKTVFPFLGSTTERGLALSVGRKLDLLSSGLWDGHTTLSFPSSGYLDLWVHEIDPVGYINLETVRDTGETLSISKRNPELVYVFDQNVVLSTTVTGSIIEVEDSDPGVLEASYKYTPYNLDYSGNTLASLEANGNVEEEFYEIAWSRGIVINTLNKKEYRNSRLLNPDESATSYMLDIAEEITKKVPVTLNHVFWTKVHWFEDMETSPTIDYVPLPMDV